MSIVKDYVPEKPMKRSDVPRPDLGEIARKWANRLELGYWDIWIRYAGHDDFSKPDRQGEASWVVGKRSAHILILDPKLCLKEHLPKLNIELTVVHELLHLCLCSFALDGDSAAIIQEEHFVDMLSHILVDNMFKEDAGDTKCDNSQ